jgi:hypothetical protein
MQPKDDETPARLLGKGAWQERHADLIPSVQSARYLIRQHKAALVASGGLLMIAGEWYVVPALFKRELVNLGRFNARAKLLADEARELEVRRRSVKAFEQILDVERCELRKAEIALGIETEAAPG